MVLEEFAMGVFKGNRVGIFEDTSVTIKVIYPKKLNTYGHGHNVTTTTLEIFMGKP